MSEAGVYRYRSKDIQREREVAMSINKEGQESASFGYAVERRRAREGRRVTDGAIAASINAIAIADLDGNLTYVNRSFLQMWGYASEKDVLGRPAVELCQAADKAGAVVAALFERGGWQGELVALRRDDSTFDVQLSASMITDVAGKPVRMVASLIDVTERKQAERMLREKNEQLDAQNEELHLQREELVGQQEELKEKTAQLEEASKLKSEFLARMSHELRTPLNAIIGFSELMLDGIPGGVNDEQKQCLADILDSGRHLLSLINDVLDLSKVEAGKMEFRLEDVDMADVIGSVVQSVRPMLHESRHRLTVSIQEGLPQVRADEGRLRQIFLNLLSNAIKFTPSGGKLDIQASGDGDWCQVSVVDNGIGLREEDQTRIFDAFMQAEAVLEGRKEGTGLGLALTRQIVETMGGTIWVESTYGKGSKFSFALPLAREGEPYILGEAPFAIPGKKLPEAKEMPLKPGQKRILVVDDDRMARSLLRAWLEREGYAVVEVSSGDDGIEEANKLMPEAVVLDILMPRKDGWQVLRELKSTPRTREIPVVITSIVERKGYGFSLGAVDYFVKPVDRQEFLERIAEVGLQPREKVLVMDDNPADVRLVASILESEGIAVLRAYGGEEGLRVAKEDRPALILLDILMPDLSGFEVIEKLRADEETRNIPIIVLTVKDLSAEELKVLSRQTTAIMRKAILRRGAFLSEVKNALGLGKN